MKFPVREIFEVSEDFSEYWHYAQMLTGDKVDGITGIKGVGPVKARKALEKLDPAEYMCYVGLRYAIAFDDPEHMFNKNMKLLKILTEPLEDD